MRLEAVGERPTAAAAAATPHLQVVGSNGAQALLQPRQLGLPVAHHPLLPGLQSLLAQGGRRGREVVAVAVVHVCWWVKGGTLPLWALLPSGAAGSLLARWWRRRLAGDGPGRPAAILPCP